MVYTYIKLRDKAIIKNNCNVYITKRKKYQTLCNLQLTFIDNYDTIKTH